MRAPSSTRLVWLAPAAVLLACTDRSELPLQIQANRFAFSDWSEPVRLGAPVNLPTANEQGPALSSDNLSLYFCSNRPGGSGGNDLWVSRRGSEVDAWEEPVNLGPGVNSPGGDCGPSLSVDGRLLFFTSNRTGGAGGNDLYMSSRTDPTDDLVWGTPVRLGPEINTTATEFSPFVTRFRGDCAGGHEEDNDAGGDKEDDDDGDQVGGCVAELYFERGSSNVATDIFVVTIDAQGTTLGAATPVAEVNSSDADGRPTVRFDGREMLLHSNRDGRVGNFDLFVSTRRSRHDPWSTPVPVDELNSSPMHEIHPYLSRDGRTVVFVRGQGQANDIWMATRTPSGH